MKRASPDSTRRISRMLSSGTTTSLPSRLTTTASELTSNARGAKNAKTPKMTRGMNAAAVTNTRSTARRSGVSRRPQDQNCDNCNDDTHRQSDDPGQPRPPYRKSLCTRTHRQVLPWTIAHMASFIDVSAIVIASVGECQREADFRSKPGGVPLKSHHFEGPIRYVMFHSAIPCGIASNRPLDAVFACSQAFGMVA